MSAPTLPCPEAVAELMRGALAWDNHACMPLRPADSSFLPQLARCRAAGMDVVSLNVGFGDSTIEEHVRMLAALRAWIADHPEDYVLAGTAAQIAAARAGGRMAILFDIEGMGAVDDQPDLVRLYYDLGVRWMLVAYNRNNRAGGGCQDDDQGLTPLGRAIVDEMAACGMIACGSHTGYRTARELIDHSPNPVIFSHSNPRGLYDHHRNIPDTLMQACATRGGVVGINGIGLFLGGADDLTGRMVRAIDYAVQRIGPEHVGLGLDYIFDAGELDEVLAKSPDMFPAELGYRPGMAMPMAAPEALPDIVLGLMRLGYPAEAITAILGGNLLRLAERIWK